MPFLEATVTLQGKASKLADVELEVKQLRETLAEYNEEFRTVRNQGREPLLVTSRFCARPSAVEFIEPFRQASDHFTAEQLLFFFGF